LAHLPTEISVLGGQDAPLRRHIVLGQALKSHFAMALIAAFVFGSSALLAELG